MKLTVSGRHLFAPGDRVRFIAAPDIEATVDCTLVHGSEFGVNVYRLVWYNDGRRHEETASEREVEEIPAKTEKVGFKPRRRNEL